MARKKTQEDVKLLANRIALLKLEEKKVSALNQKSMRRFLTKIFQKCGCSSFFLTKTAAYLFHMYYLLMTFLVCFLSVRHGKKLKKQRKRLMKSLQLDRETLSQTSRKISLSSRKSKRLKRLLTRIRKIGRVESRVFKRLKF